MSIFGSVLYEYEDVDNTVKKTVEKAISEQANLRSADLRSANLRSANLSSAKNLKYAYWNKFTIIDKEYKKLLSKDRFVE